jgi:hypothetical protein
MEPLGAPLLSWLVIRAETKGGPSTTTISGHVDERPLFPAPKWNRDERPEPKPPSPPMNRAQTLSTYSDCYPYRCRDRVLPLTLVVFSQSGGNRNQRDERRRQLTRSSPQFDFTYKRRQVIDGWWRSQSEGRVAAVASSLVTTIQWHYEGS